MAKLPNLELLEYKVRMALRNQEEFKDGKRKYANLVCEMFPQVWSNTSGGFEGCGGCALTEEYTTVFQERETGLYVVCFGDTPCYVVHEANQRFLNDLRDKTILGLRSARGVY